MIREHRQTLQRGTCMQRLIDEIPLLIDFGCSLRVVSEKGARASLDERVDW